MYVAIPSVLFTLNFENNNLVAIVCLTLKININYLFFFYFRLHQRVKEKRNPRNITTTKEQTDDQED